MAQIIMDHVEKTYAGGVKAIDDLSLDPAVTFAGYRLPVPDGVVEARPGLVGYGPPPRPGRPYAPRCGWRADSDGPGRLPGAPLG
jgi:hypothetical protein